MGNKMQTGIIIYAVMGLMFVLIILLAAMVLQLRAKVSALQNRYRYFMTGEKGESLERQLAAEVTELREMTRSGEDMLCFTSMSFCQICRSGLFSGSASSNMMLLTIPEIICLSP